MSARWVSHKEIKEETLLVKDAHKLFAMRMGILQTLIIASHD
jgi:hypothetical protein